MSIPIFAAADCPIGVITACSSAAASRAPPSWHSIGAGNRRAFADCGVALCFNLAFVRPKRVLYHDIEVQSYVDGVIFDELSPSTQARSMTTSHSGQPPPSPLPPLRPCIACARACFAGARACFACVSRVFCMCMRVFGVCARVFCMCFACVSPAFHVRACIWHICARVCMYFACFSCVSNVCARVWRACASVACASRVFDVLVWLLACSTCVPMFFYLCTRVCFACVCACVCICLRVLIHSQDRDLRVGATARVSSALSNVASCTCAPRVTQQKFTLRNVFLGLRVPALHARLHFAHMRPIL